MDEGPPPDSDRQPLPSEDVPCNADGVMSKQRAVPVDMHVPHAFNVIFAPIYSSSFTLWPPLHLTPHTKTMSPALDPPNAGVSYPLAHDCRPLSTASGQRAEAARPAQGRKACIDSLAGTPFALSFPLVARHGHGAFTLLSMRAVESPLGCMLLADGHPRTEAHTTLLVGEQMDCSDDLPVTGGHPIKGGVALAPPSHPCPVAESVGPSINTGDSVGLDD